MIRAVMLLALAGCYETGSFPCTGTNCESPTDGTDIGDGSEKICVGAAPGLLGQKCFVPRESVTFPEVLDTGNSDLCELSEDAVCFITGTQLMLPSRLDVSGARPLVLWASDSITIGDNGYLDVASHSDATDKKIGPGSNPDDCVEVNGLASMATTPFIGGGGAGGAFRSSGGGGGGAHNTMNTIINSTVGPPATEMVFRGGCNGGKGGFADTDVGFGGGAIYLMAKNEITVGGVIDASGSGGTGGFKSGAGGGTFGGGNGGGSGGLIGLEAPTIKLLGARLVALGGAGGSGAASSNDSNDGQDPQPDPPVRAPAAAATTASNSGGAGCSTIGGNGQDGGSVTVGEGGGGGGGGGCGYIVSIGGQPVVDATTTFAPPRSFPPQ